MKNLLRPERSVRNPEKASGARLLIPLCFTFILAPLAFGLSAYAAKIYHAAGTTSATFLKLGVGARAVAMGGAFTAVADDPYSIYWNPAGLATLEGEKNVGFFHNDHFQGLKQEFMLYTAPAEGLPFLKKRGPRSGVWGLGLDYFYTPKDMERRSGLNENDPLAPISPVEGKFGAYDLAFSAGYGWKHERGLSLGAAVKVIRQSIDTKSAGSAALDLGALKEFSWLGKDFTAGFSVQNIGPGIKFISRRYDLPLVFKAGLSRRLPDSGALFSLEADKPIDNYPSFVFGAEYPLVPRLALRTGYRYRHTGNELGSWSGFSTGAGLAFGRFSFDYAFSPFGDLGNSHRFSLNAAFGKPAGVARPKGAGGAARSDVAVNNSRTVAYALTSKALMVSQRGIKYQVRAVSDGADLYEFSFITMMRGAVAASASVAEGELSPDMLNDFPAGPVPVKAWQFASGQGNVQGDIVFKLKLRKTAEPAEMELLYRTRSGWGRAKLEVKSSDGEFAWFEAAAPYSACYVLAVTRGNQ